MRQPSYGRLISARVLCLSLLMTCLELLANADQIEMSNGDRYIGRVVSLGNDTLVLQSEVLGTLKLPRSRIATISLGAAAPPAGTNGFHGVALLSRTNRTAQLRALATTNSHPGFNAAMHELNTNSSVIQQVQQQFLSGAGPEAQTKFNDLVSGLMSGKLGVNELRAEAKNTLAQAQNSRKELGEEGGAALDSYLAILEGFLKETEPATQGTNSPGLSKPPILTQSQGDE
jgi:hypothetical protein